MSAELRLQIHQLITDDNQEPRFLDEYDDAIIGLDQATMGVIYSVKKILEIIENEDEETTEEDALEHFGYNVVRGVAYMGDTKPILCFDLFLV